MCLKHEGFRIDNKSKVMKSLQKLVSILIIAHCATKNVSLSCMDDHVQENRNVRNGDRYNLSATLVE